VPRLESPPYMVDSHRSPPIPRSRFHRGNYFSEVPQATARAITPNLEKTHCGPLPNPSPPPHRSRPCWHLRPHLHPHLRPHQSSPANPPPSYQTRRASSDTRAHLHPQTRPYPFYTPP